MPDAPITVLLVDDRAAVLHGLQLRLGLESDLSVIGEAADGRVALTLANERAPDVVVIDVAMPAMDGFAVTAAMRNAAPNAAVILLTLHDDRQTRSRAVRLGAAGVVSKHEPSQALVDAIRRAAQRNRRISFSSKKGLVR